jgi:hypothetical protein
MATLFLSLLAAGAYTAPIQPLTPRLAPAHPLPPLRATERARPPLLTAAAPGDVPLSDNLLTKALQDPTGDGPAEAKPVARLLGYMMTVGALGVFLPIILRMLSTGTADGFSRLTWGMQIIGCAALQ